MVDNIIEKLKALSPKLQKEAEDFVEFLLSKTESSRDTIKEKYYGI